MKDEKLDALKKLMKMVSMEDEEDDEKEPMERELSITIIGIPKSLKKLKEKIKK